MAYLSCLGVGDGVPPFGEIPHTREVGGVGGQAVLDEPGTGT